MQIKSYSKAEIAAHYGISADKLSSWLKEIEHLLPHYKRTAKVLKPAQVKVIFEELGEI
jgi:predicted DNA-binding protein YlxM (UPF0122 family)